MKSIKKKTLEQEAQEFRKLKIVEEPPMSARIYLAGQALSGLLAASRGGYVRSDEVKREAYRRTDRLLED